MMSELVPRVTNGWSPGSPVGDMWEYTTAYRGLFGIAVTSLEVTTGDSSSLNCYTIVFRRTFQLFLYLDLSL